jgi:hypothetical protein
MTMDPALGLPMDLFELPMDTILEADTFGFPFGSSNFPEIVHISDEQLDFCVGQFKESITALVQQSQNAFIHCSSYRDSLPSFYQDLLGTSALYLSKSPQTQALVFQILDRKVSALINHFNVPSWPIDEGLLGVQALVVYQIIRLFDGSIRPRAAAEHDFMHLQAWTGNLQQTYQASQHACSSSPYKRWIYLESVRRTIMMSVLLQGLYGQLRDGACALVPLLAGLPMSMSASLWKMPEIQWWKSQGRENPFIILTYSEFVDEWNEGRVVDVDGFESMLLVACRHAKPAWVVTDMNEKSYDNNEGK